MSGGIVGRQVTVVGGSQEEEEKEEEKEGEEEDRCARARPPPATWQRATLAKHGSHSPPFHAFWSPCVLINQDQNNQNAGITLRLAGPICNFSIYIGTRFEYLLLPRRKIYLIYLTIYCDTGYNL